MVGQLLLELKKLLQFGKAVTWLPGTQEVDVNELGIPVSALAARQQRLQTMAKVSSRFMISDISFLKWSNVLDFHLGAPRAIHYSKYHLATWIRTCHYTQIGNA